MGILRFIRRANPAPVAAVSIQDVLDMQKKPSVPRADRRREYRETLKASQQARSCWRCGYGTIAGVRGSNLARSTDLDGQPAWSHANPSVCAGAVLAVTSMARESVKEASSDLVRTVHIRAEGLLRQYFHNLKTGFVTFLGEDPVRTKGAAHPTKTRGASR